MYKPKMYDPRKFKRLRPSKKKDLRYWQTNLKPLGDFDRDKKINVLDCYPYDPNRQGITDVFKKGVQKVKEFKEEHQKQEAEYQEKAEDYSYLIVQGKDDKWFNLGAYTDEDLEQLILEAKNQYKKVLVSKDPKKADKLNRVQMYEQFEGGVEKTITKGVEEVKHLKEQFLRTPKTKQSKEREIDKFIHDSRSSMIKRHRSGMPPASRGWWGSSAYRGQEKIPSPQKVQTVPIGTEEPMEEMEIEKPVYQDKYGYSRKSPFYQERSSFFNYSKGVETCVPYRPVSKYQVFVPYKPVGRRRLL